MDKEYKSERFKKILADYESFLNEESSSLLGTDDFSEIAQFYYEKGEYDKAEKAINTALSIFPGSVAPLAFKARFALLKENNPQKADDIAEEIDDKDDPDYVLLKAEIMIAENRPQDADDYLEEAYEGYYDDEYYDDMPLDVAALFADYGEMDYAEKWMGRSDEEDENLYKEVRARILMSDGKFEESERILNELIDSDPYSSYYWNQLATEKMLNDDLSGSVASSDYALAIDPDDRDALLNKGNGMLELENYKEAEKLFRRYSRLEPGKDTGYIMTAIALMAQNRAQEASQSLRKALEVCRKDSAATWRNESVILFQLVDIENYLGHLWKVRDYLDQIENLYRKSITDIETFGKFVADLDVARGHVALEEGDIEGALKWFDQAATDSNNNPNVFVRIAVSAYGCGYVQYAYRLLHELLYVQKAESAMGFAYLAMCCKRLGLDDERKWAEKKKEEADEASDNDDDEYEIDNANEE